MSAIPYGWEPLPTQAFGRHVGPLYRPVGGNKRVAGFGDRTVPTADVL